MERRLAGGGSRVLLASAVHCKEGDFLEEGTEATRSSAPAACASADGRGGGPVSLALGSLKPRHPRDVPGGAEATEPCAILSSRSWRFLMNTPFLYRGDLQVTALYTSLYIMNLAQDNALFEITQMRNFLYNAVLGKNIPPYKEQYVFFPSLTERVTKLPLVSFPLWLPGHSG